MVFLGWSFHGRSSHGRSFLKTSTEWSGTLIRHRLHDVSLREVMPGSRAATLWLDVIGQHSSCVIRQTDRLRTLVGSLPSPHRQTPTLVVLFESPECSYFPAGHASGVHLRLDPDTVNAPSPLLVASTSSLLSQAPPHAWPAGERSSSSIIQQTSFPRHGSATVLPRILIPFADALCFMCANLSDIRVIEAQINQWAFASAEIGRDVPMPPILVLLSDSHPLQPTTVRRQLAARTASLKIAVVKIGQSTWSTDGMTPLRERLTPVLLRARRGKSSRKLLFSGCHVMRLLEDYLSSGAIDRSFLYVKIARWLHPVAADLMDHLRCFVEALPKDRDEDFVAESIASSLLLDHFTPGMHGQSPSLLPGPPRNPRRPLVVDGTNCDPIAP